jgi:hypothetical protein
VRFIPFIFLFVLFYGCHSAKEENPNSADDASGIMRHFPNFPENHFKEIRLGDETENTSVQLEKNGFKRIEDQPNHFQSEEMEIILNEGPKLNAFRLFLFNSKDIEEQQEMIDFFSKEAKSKSISKEFSAFEFETADQVFSITIFIQPDFIRLNYELKTSH